MSEEHSMSQEHSMSEEGSGHWRIYTVHVQAGRSGKTQKDC